LTCVIETLSSGGAARALATLVKEWSEQGVDVTVITFDVVASDPPTFPKAVRRVSVSGFGPSRSFSRAISANARRVRTIRRAVRESAPDVVLSFIDQMNVLVLLALIGLRLPTVISERTYPPLHDLRLPWRVLRGLLYPFADILVMQTERGKSWAERVVAAQRVRVIPNALAREDDGFGLTPHGSRSKVVAGVGRLIKSKGFDVLLRAFEASGIANSGWLLEIIGDGPELRALKHEAATLGISPKVQFHGFRADPNGFLANAQIFASASRYEGFPNALLEAMAAGCAAISTDCPTGPSDIIKNEFTGFLVPVDDVRSLAHALRKLAGDASLRGSLALRGRGDVTERFRARAISRDWVCCLTDAIESRRGRA
jgi:GalNAc-alpha-(1->4)-GalNAc-alpha-(1->3)-diNAcBac-PP-undecaprenol alpha-1,4-N-acetyl-D-galactosaminyltransferase